ncbi:MAG: ROK family protein, partial [Nocardioidaceae bacterium]
MAEPVVIGIDFGGSKIATGVCECDGTLLGTASVDTRPGDGGPANLMSGLQAARELASRVAPRRPVAAVGACTFGIPGELGIALAPAIPGWAGLALEEELRRSFPGAEVRVATDVKAAAQVEADSGALAGHDPGIYVNLGSGLAVAVVASGKVLQGRHGAAGEVAYNLRTVRDVGVPAHARTNLEDAVSGRALTRAMSVSDDGAPSQPDTADPRFGESLRVSVTELAFHLV